MNLLALLERRPPPPIPPGIGRYHQMSDDDRFPPVVAPDSLRESPYHPERKENRAKVYEAVKAGLMLSDDICKHTGLSKATVFAHGNVLAALGLIRIARCGRGSKAIFTPCQTPAEGEPVGARKD